MDYPELLGNMLGSKYRNGRCFLAGDSAHQWLPAGGLGMNVGVADPADLAWNLEAILKGYGGTYFLDLFEIEQRPIADSTRCFALSLGIPVISSICKQIRLFDHITRL